jgi:4-diphosphocytidyl-2-C-methyl-D-erythritol kinase
MQETAFAKLNLALHVRAREADGYHRIETIFAFAEDGDRLSVQPSDALTLSVTGPFASQVPTGADNLALRAALALRDRCGATGGAALALDKILPVAAGIGGGSADAAAALRLLARFWNLAASETELLPIAGSLGADVPACLLSRPMRGEGRGDRLTPLAAPGGAPLLLVNPGIPLATPDVFRAWDGVDRGPLVDALTGRNDLEAPALRLVPEIAQVLAALRESATLARMSGSGATCFALYPDEASRDAAAMRIADAHPRWWLLATRLRD